MKLALVFSVILLLGSTAQSSAATPPDALSGNYLACVIGQGSVEILRGVSAAKALQRAEKACKASIKAIFDAYGSEGDVGALLTHDHDLAAEALSAIESRFKD